MPSLSFARIQQANTATSADAPVLSTIPPNDGEIIACTLAALKAITPECQCSNCHLLLTDTHTVPGCLHRICGNCISTINEKNLMGYGNKCPSCRDHTFANQGVVLSRDESYNKLVSVACLLLTYLWKLIYLECCIVTHWRTVLYHRYFRFAH